jgi:hypothetical protein
LSLESKQRSISGIEGGVFPGKQKPKSISLKHARCDEEKTIIFVGFMFRFEIPYL